MEFAQALELYASCEDAQKRKYAQSQKKALQKLYDLLEIDAVLSSVRSKTEIPEADLRTKVTLLVEADDFLHGIPFHALYKGGKYLYERVRDMHACLSVESLREQKYPDPGELRCVFFGAPGKFSHGDGGNIESVENYLPGVEREARGLQNLLGGSFQALGYGGPSESQARTEALRRYHGVGEILCVSAHGKPGGVVELLDGPVSWQDLMEEDAWDFRRQAVVILSCCFLGQQESVGKEMLGMVSALSAKGACSVLSALWAVDDRAASVFVPLFAKHFAENIREKVGHPRSLALRKAMDELRQDRNFDAPYCFAPFFLSGLP